MISNLILTSMQNKQLIHGLIQELLKEQRLPKGGKMTLTFKLMKWKQKKKEGFAQCVKPQWREQGGNASILTAESNQEADCFILDNNQPFVGEVLLRLGCQPSIVAVNNQMIKDVSRLCTRSGSTPNFSPLLIDTTFNIAEYYFLLFFPRSLRKLYTGTVSGWRRDSLSRRLPKECPHCPRRLGILLFCPRTIMCQNLLQGEQMNFRADTQGRSMYFPWSGRRFGSWEQGLLSNRC